MLRDQSLIPLSRQHQHALALCVRIARASPIAEADLRNWQEEIAQQFALEIKFHFAAEERVLFPVASAFEELRELIDQLRTDHETLRNSFADAEARTMTPAQLAEFAGRLSAHIRKEERQLFERMQKLLAPTELAALGAQLEDALKDAAQACALPRDSAARRPGA